MFTFINNTLEDLNYKFRYNHSSEEYETLSMRVRNFITRHTGLLEATDIELIK